MRKIYVLVVRLIAYIYIFLYMIYIHILNICRCHFVALLFAAKLGRDRSSKIFQDLPRSSKAKPAAFEQVLLSTPKALGDELVGAAGPAGCEAVSRGCLRLARADR